MGKIVHIVYSQSAEGSFKQAIKKEVIRVDKLIALYDNISNGEIKNLKDIKSRQSWWKELNGEEDYLYYETNELEDNWKKFYDDISEINECDNVYLWYGNCNREICGMLYTLDLLKNKAIKCYCINVSDKIIQNNNEPFNLVIKNSVSEIAPKKLGEYLELARKIELNKYKELLNQWNNLIKENSVLRSYVNGNMVSVSEDYFDKDILKFTDKEYKKAPRIFCEALANIKPKISDEYIFWRMIELVKLRKINFKGNFGILRKMEICISDQGLGYLRNFSQAMDFWNERKRADESKLEFTFTNDIKEQGILEERIRIAKNLVELLDLDTIANKTGLTVGQIISLKLKE